MVREVRQIEPMLARTVPEEHQDELMKSSQWVAEEKFDGERNLLHIHRDGSATITSRRISKATGRFAEKNAHVPHLTRPGAWPSELAGTVLDGEMIHPDGFKATASVFRSKPERAVRLQEQTGFIEFRVFDILYLRDQDVSWKPWHSRRDLLERVVRIYEDDIPRQVKLTKVVYGNYKEKFLKEVWSRGGEGIILKHVYGKYIPGSRSEWVKVKSVITEDVVIIGPVQPEMEYTGKYPDTWEYWAAKVGPDQWKRVTREEAIRYRESGVEVVPANSTWWHKRLAGFRYGQYVNDATYKRIGSPEVFDSYVDPKTNELWRLVEMGQTGGGTEAENDKWAKEAKSRIGKVVEIKANGRFSETGKFRHPHLIRWRDDKNPEDCRWDA